jgi:hypothetical protein
MGHYAKVVNEKVTQIIVADEEFFKTFVDSSPGQWIKTSYNTYGNKHATGGTPLRGNFAGIDFIYDAKSDVFYAPQPYLSWALDSNWLWQPPIPMPIDGKLYIWDELIKNWVEHNG